jgi:hypothetical protein
LDEIARYDLARLAANTRPILSRSAEFGVWSRAGRLSEIGREPLGSFPLDGCQHVPSKRSHGENTGSSPVGVTSLFKGLATEWLHERANYCKFTAKP